MEDISQSFKRFIHTDGQEYFAKNHIYKNLPIVSGLPIIKCNNYRIKIEGHFRNKYNMRIPIMKLISTPKECRFDKVINQNIDRYGSLEIAATGTLGSGKTNLVNGIVEIDCALDYRIIYCIDRRFECRHLAFCGVWKENEFIPFKLKIFVPKGFQFLKGNYLWEERSKNVSLHEFSHISDLIDAFEPYTIVCVYTECFTSQAIINFFLELSYQLALVTDTMHHYLIVHQELETVLENSPEKDKYKLMEAFAKVFVYFRKDKIGFLCAFHEKSEIYWKNGDKFNVILAKRPVLKKSLQKYDEDAKRFSRSQVNIAISGYWMKHTIGMFPEVNDKYRAIPTRVSYKFENGEFEIDSEQHLTDELVKYLSNDLYLKIWILRLKGYSYREIESLIDTQLKYQRIGEICREISEIIAKRIELPKEEKTDDHEKSIDC